MTHQPQCRHATDIPRPGTRRTRTVVHCPYCQGDRSPRTADTPARPAYGDVFSAESEARVCELVLGDRRHGWPARP